MSKRKTQRQSVVCNSNQCKPGEICDTIRSPPICANPGNLSVERLKEIGGIEDPETWEDVQRIYNIEEHPEGVSEDEVRERVLQQLQYYHPRLTRLPKSPISVSTLLNGRQVLVKLIQDKQNH